MSAGAPYGPYAPAPAQRPQGVSLPVPRFRPVWTYVLLAANVAIWAVVFFTLGGLGDRLLTLGVKDDGLIAQGEYWRLLTAMFLHIEIIHIFSNMLALYALGPQVESTFGHARFLTVYFLGGLLGSALSFLLSPNQSLGASGAIYGLLGALVAFLVRNRQGFGEYGRRRLMNLLGVIGINLLLTISVPYIDLWGHAGGLLGGLALGWALTPVYRVDRDTLWGMPSVIDASSPRARIVVTAAVTLVLLAVIAAGTLRWS
jgi:rhomboid protease GluP